MIKSNVSIAKSSSSVTQSKVASNIEKLKTNTVTNPISLATTIFQPKITTILEAIIIAREGEIMEETLQLGENISSSQVYWAVCLIANKIYLADITDETKRDVIGIALQSGNAGEFIKIKTGDAIANILWDWIPTSQNKIFLTDKTGDSNLTQDFPNDDFGYIEIGYPLERNKIKIAIQQPIIYV